jgi:ribosome-binding protein aMBF1 (putative translation factor)
MKKSLRKRSAKHGRARKNSRTPKPRESGRLHYPVDGAWREGIRGILVARGLTQAELARMIKASPAAVSQLLNTNTPASTLVAAIHGALGLVPPPATTVVQIAEPRTDTAAA